VGEILEACIFVHEGEFHSSGGAVSLFGDDYFRNPFVNIIVPFFIKSSREIKSKYKGDI
jgi:hypothetical protein